MEDSHLKKQLGQLVILTSGLAVIVIILFAGVIYIQIHPEIMRVNRNDPETGSDFRPGNHQGDLLEDEGLDVVVVHCTGCHSAKLISQNRATKEGWLSMIRWMQGTQGLWDLGENEGIILTYLATNYAPIKKGRRPKLEGIEWYELELTE